MYEYCKMSCIYFSHTIRFNKKTLESTIIIASHFLTISSVWNSNERQFLLMSSSRRSYNKHKHCFITVVQTNRSLNDLGNQESEKIDIIVYNSPKTFRFRYVYIHRFWQNDLKTLCLVFFFHVQVLVSVSWLNVQTIITTNWTIHQLQLRFRHELKA